jgi:hypothetical protein
MTDSTTGTVKPVSHYVSTAAIDALVEQAGAHLESVSPTQKCLMSAVLADHLASGNEYYSITDSLHYADPHHVLEGELGNALVRIATEDSSAVLAGLLQALAALIADDIATGAYDA